VAGAMKRFIHLRFTISVARNLRLFSAHAASDNDF
jgi:hypothetical protein